MHIDYGLYYTGDNYRFFNDDVPGINFDLDGCSDYLKANGLSDEQIRNTEILLAPPYYREHMELNDFTEREIEEFFKSEGIQEDYFPANHLIQNLPAGYKRDGTYEKIDDIHNKIIITGISEEQTNQILNHELQHLIDSSTGVMKKEWDKYYTPLVKKSSTYREAIKKLTRRSIVSDIGTAVTALSVLYVTDELDAPPWVRYSVLAAALGAGAIRALVDREAKKDIFTKFYNDYIDENHDSPIDREEYLKRPWEIRAREASNNGNKFVSFNEEVVR
jgi:hypothetical protein